MLIRYAAFKKGVLEGYGTASVGTRKEKILDLHSAVTGSS